MAFKYKKLWITAGIVAALCVGAAWVAIFVWFDEIKEAVFEQVVDVALSTNKASPEAKALKADIERYRAESKSMEPAKAVEAWLALYERAKKIGPEGYSLLDTETGHPLGAGTMLGALPPPDAWPVLRKAAQERVEKAPKDADALGLRLVTELLAADREAATATLKEIDGVGGATKEQVSADVADVRGVMAELYGSREEIAATFAGTLTGKGKQQYLDVDVPDLVGLVGEERATAVLRDAIAKPVRLRVPEGAQTRVLARRLALENIATLKEPQWGLVDAIEAGPLYEAIEKRFSDNKAPGQMEGYRRSNADRYYFLYLVLSNRHAEAEKAMDRLARGGNGMSLPRREIEALRRAGKHDALLGFLHAVLGRRPELGMWDVYTKEAAYLGKSEQALQLVEQQLQRKDLSAEVLMDLRFRRVNALLAADKVEPAVADLRTLLAEPPAKDQKGLYTRANGALRLAGLGRLLNQREQAETGLAFVRAVLALPPSKDAGWQHSEILRKTFAELRKSGREDDALALAKAELERKPVSDLTSRFRLVDPAAKAATAELSGIHGRAGRHTEVLALLEQSPNWGAADLRGALGAKDSLGTPVALIAARAQAATGKTPQAIALARALVEELPGSDPGYEFLAATDPEAHTFLDKLYAADQFEERPLIWKSILYTRSGRWVEAESMIRRAITIDPSDGEEGPNDRMRAYAVLADVLEEKGQKDAAQVFRGAVRAIRISERTDELHSLGLYERAFAGYREALAQFSDAYCIQSRLALRLMEAGKREQAFEHYRRAYELMPDSFGRVESHCFGCENVFEGADQQTLAEKVFTELLAKDPQKPQLHYLLGYLNKERGRYDEAYKRFSEAVRLDPEYLNAWKHLHEIGKHYYIEPGERDKARLKLLQLDPRQRHVRYELDGVGDLKTLWQAVQAAYRPAETGSLHPLPASAAAVAAAQAKMPDATRSYAMDFDDYDASRGSPARKPDAVLGKHKLMRAGAGLLATQ